MHTKYGDIDWLHYVREKGITSDKKKLECWPCAASLFSSSSSNNFIIHTKWGILLNAHHRIQHWLISSMRLISSILTNNKIIINELTSAKRKTKTQKKKNREKHITKKLIDINKMKNRNTQINTIISFRNLIRRRISKHNTKYNTFISLVD